VVSIIDLHLMRDDARVGEALVAIVGDDAAAIELEPLWIEARPVAPRQPRCLPSRKHPSKRALIDLPDADQDEVVDQQRAGSRGCAALGLAVSRTAVITT
jgi:hypothetical protein